MVALDWFCQSLAPLHCQRQGAALVVVGNSHRRMAIHAYVAAAVVLQLGLRQGEVLGQGLERETVTGSLARLLHRSGSRVRERAVGHSNGS